MSEPKRIIVSVSGGLVQNIEGATEAGVIVEVRDYDVSEVRDPCPDCNGTGFESKLARSPCVSCSGSGHDPNEYDRDEEGEECSIAEWGGPLDKVGSAVEREA